MNLLVSENGYDVIPDPKLFMIRQFRELLDSRSANKDILTKELGYLYFYANPESIFADQTDDITRHIDVVMYVGLPQGWSVDDVLQRALECYDIFINMKASTRLLKTARKAVNKLEAQLDDMDLNERDKNDRPIWNMQHFNSIIKTMPDTMEALDKAERIYIKGKEEQTKTVGNKDLSFYDD